MWTALARRASQTATRRTPTAATARAADLATASKTEPPLSERERAYENEYFNKQSRAALDKLKRAVRIDEQKEADELRLILKGLDVDEQLLESLTARLLLWKHDQQPHGKP